MVDNSTERPAPKDVSSICLRPNLGTINVCPPCRISRSRRLVMLRPKPLHVTCLRPKSLYVTCIRPKPLHATCLRHKPFHVTCLRPKPLHVTCLRPKPLHATRLRPKPLHATYLRPKPHFRRCAHKPRSDFLFLFLSLAATFLLAVSHRIGLTSEQCIYRTVTLFYRQPYMYLCLFYRQPYMYLCLPFNSKRG